MGNYLKPLMNFLTYILALFLGSYSFIYAKNETEYYYVAVPVLYLIILITVRYICKRQTCLYLFDKYIFPLVLFFTLGIIAQSLAHIANIFSQAYMYPYDIAPTEGQEVYKAWMLSQGENIYPLLYDYPYLITIYPPFYHFLVSLLLRFTGPMMTAGRIVSIGSSLGLFLLLFFRVTGNSKKNKAIVLLGIGVASAFLYSPIMSRWGFITRPDLLSVFLTFVTLFLFEKGTKDNNPNRIIAMSAVTGALAYLTKLQTSLIFVVIPAYWFIQKKKKVSLLVLFFTVSVSIILITQFVLSYLTSWQYYTDVYLYPSKVVKSPDWWKLSNVVKWFSYLISDYFVLIFLSVPAIVYRIKKNITNIYDIYLLVSVAFLFMFLGSLGAEDNYLLGTTYALYLSAGITITGILSKYGPLRKAFAVTVLVLICINLNLGSVSGSKGFLNNPAFQTKEKINNIIRKIPGPVLIDNEASFSLLNGKMRLIDAIDAQLMEKFYLIDVRRWKIITDLRSRNIDAVVEIQRFLPERVQALVTGYYDRTEVIGSYEIYRPKPDNVRVLEVTGLNENFLSSKSDLEVAITNNNIVQSGPEFISPKSDSGEIIYIMKSKSLIKNIDFRIFPRVNGGDEGLSVSSSFNGTYYSPVVDYKKDDPGWTDMWNPLEKNFVADSKVAYLKFSFMSGNTQLWFNESRPMFIYVTVEKTGK